ncbi:hypothetical protein [Candidatus Hakubella thermalkaliphila]|uniref:hypothetical protein n=1 Tax=Candidatus Hakubella thermalkaliphila TaxID=2754717 RepID=UPI001594713F|nr:hypothetical protein [Candidatus Hakubella thermalkaliphila]
MALSYAALVGYLVDQLANRYATWTAQRPGSSSRLARVGLVLGAILAWLIIFPVQPVSTLRYSLIYDPRPVPEEYSRLEVLLHPQPDFFRTLWLPYHQRFGYYSSQHPALVGVDMGTSVLSPLLRGDPRNDWVSYVFSYLSQPFSPLLLRLLSVRYIILPYDSQDDVYIHQGQPLYYYQRLVENIPSVRFVPFEGETRLYEVPEPLPHLYVASDSVNVTGDITAFPAVSMTEAARDAPALVFMRAQTRPGVPSSGSRQSMSLKQELAKRVEGLFGGTDALLVYRDSLPNMILSLIGEEFGTNGPTLLADEYTFNVSDQTALLAILAKGREGQNLAAVSVSPGQGSLIQPDVMDDTLRLLRSSRDWRYFGNFYLQPGQYTLTLLKQGPQPLKDWKRIQQSNLAYDLYETTLPDFVPAEYTTKDAEPKVIIYRGGKALRPTWNIAHQEAGEQAEWYEVGNAEPRRVVINVPKGQKPAGAYTFSYVVPRLSDEVEQIIIVPVPMLEEITNKVLTILQDPEYRIANLFTPESPAPGRLPTVASAVRDSFYVPNEEEYLLRARISPGVWQSNVYLLPERTQWRKELANWSVSGSGLQVAGSELNLKRETGRLQLPFVLYANNWHGEERDHHGGWRWGTNNMKLLVLNPNSLSLQGTLTFRVTTIRERDLHIAVNGQLTQATHIPAHYDRRRRDLGQIAREFFHSDLRRSPYEPRYPPGWSTVTIEDVTLKPGENEVVLYTPQGAQVMDEELGNGDEREVSIQLWDDMRFEVTGKGSEQDVAIGNTQYEYSTVGKNLVLKAYFDGDSQEQEYILMARDFPGVDLEQYPFFNFTYKVSDPTVQTADAAFGIDYSGDGQTDGYVLASSVPAEGEMQISLNLFEAAKERFPDQYYKEKKDLKLVRLFLIPHKVWGLDVKNTGEAGRYTFKFGDLQLYSESAISVPSRTDPTVFHQYAFPVKQGKEEILRDSTLADMPVATIKIDGIEYPLYAKAGEALLGRDGFWTESIRVPLKKGLHEVEIVPSKTFKVDLVEIANKPYVPQEPKATVDFRKINPTRYEVSVDAQEPFWLVFSESYHEGWKAYLVDTSGKGQIANKAEDRPWYEWSALLTWLFEGRRRIELKDHYLVNAYANGWYVPQTGQYKITLEFVPQRLFEIGVLISGTTLLGCLGYLGYDWRKRRRARKSNEATES